jgi:ParB-like chromosome segregation protein Spo0J
MNDPIAIWKDNLIIEGHGRLIACKELGYTEVPIIRLDHLTDEERKAYTLAHNKLTMNSDFDLDLLNDELMSFDTIDMKDFGFDDVFDEFDETELDDEREKEKINVSIVFEKYSDYECIKDELEQLVSKTNGNISIKMI